MPVSRWTIAEPRKLAFEDPVTALRVRIVDGTVNVVGTDEPDARLEVSAIDGPPLVVTQEDGKLTVAYEDLPWPHFLGWFDPGVSRRSAVVTLVVAGRLLGRGRRDRRRGRRLRHQRPHRGPRRLR